jgi:tRNA 2-selenouridine synthase
VKISVDEFLNGGFDYVLDVRSPREYEESHIPGALNFFVLNNEQHSEVGYLYKRVSKEDAQKKGLEYILCNISENLKRFDFKKSDKIAVYCARGGKRSESLYVILSQLNLKVYKIEGGYKAYRKKVVDFFENYERRFIVLRGNSGCGKSELLKNLSPSLDLEGLANHYGSMFGFKGEQPSQKQFENEMFEILRKIPKEKYIFTEAESSKIGKLQIPGSVLKNIRNGIQVEITAPLNDRIERILKYYGNIDKENFMKNLEKIKKYISTSVYEDLKNCYEKGDLKKVAEILLRNYYDRVYKKRKPHFKLENSDLSKTVEKLENLRNKLESLSY